MKVYKNKTNNVIFYRKKFEINIPCLVFYKHMKFRI